MTIWRWIFSTASQLDAQTEWLSGGLDLVDWLERAGAIAPTIAANFRKEGDMRSLDSIAKVGQGLARGRAGKSRFNKAISGTSAENSMSR